MSKSLDYIADPVDRDLLEVDLNAKHFVRNTGKGDHKVYIFKAADAPNAMREVGRLRELSFSMAGGGTGKEIDVDDLDFTEKGYMQLVVYAPEDREIIGGYRFIDGAQLDYSLKPLGMSTAHYFNFSDEFINDYLPHTIELGRSFVQPNYQPNINPRKGIYALDNLWDGLGAIVTKHPDMKYFFGKVTMYPEYNQEARDAVLSFMQNYFPDPDKLVTAKDPLELSTDLTDFHADLKDKSFKEGLRVLTGYVKERKELIPPLIKNYMQLSPTMRSFGTCLNNEFGLVEETGIMVTLADIYEEKTSRYIVA